MYNGIYFLINFHLDVIYFISISHDTRWLQMRLWFLMCVFLTMFTMAMIVFYQFRMREIENEDALDKNEKKERKNMQGRESLN